jgi:DMSO/TMAO reductase YedYZ molybdopterin-dependent catalytic subunit
MTGVGVRPSWHDYYAEAEPGPPGWWAAVAGGTAAACGAAGATLVLRSTLQVRSTPERVLEWLLLFVPLDVFESGLQRFGFSAKRYALYVAIVLMLALLAGLGALALRRRWSLWILLGLGIGLWLFTMLVIMPVTSAGIFALDLVENRRATILGYLGTGLLYSAVLALAAVVLAERDPQGSDAHAHLEVGGMPPRRTVLAAMGSTVAVFAVTYILDWLLPRRTGLPTIVVADPQEPVPSGGIDQPNPHPNVVGTPAAAAPEATDAPAAQAPTGVPKATAAPTSTLPQPAEARSLNRDQDGAVLSTGRRPGELSAAITSNDTFYIVTKNAGGDPVLSPDEWRLVVDGEVARSFELDYAALRRLPVVEITKTLECISNLVDQCELAPFGCDLISNATWKGVRLSDIFNLVGGIRPGATHIATISADEYTSSLPIEVAMSPDALLVYEMNGQVLPREHGYPARILVPGRYGMKNAKWVVALRPMRREFVDWYGQRNWSREAVVKTMTRIDVPARGARVRPGPQRIAGIAYAGDRGIEAVEYSSDGGETWTTAEFLEVPPNPDVWVRWEGTFTAPAGQEVQLVARAIDGEGTLQTETFSLAQPDGASGWNNVTVRAG